MKTKLVLGIVAIVSVFAYFLVHPRGLPEDFILRERVDDTSSGGDRIGTAGIIVRGGEIISGEARYVANSGRGIHEDYRCVFQGGRWNTLTGESCTFTALSLPVSRGEIEQQIRTGVLKQQGDACRRFDKCYIIESVEAK